MCSGLFNLYRLTLLNRMSCAIEYAAEFSGQDAGDPLSMLWPPSKVVMKLTSEGGTHPCETKASANDPQNLGQSLNRLRRRMSAARAMHMPSSKSL